ncbi:PspA/IM30 family protein [Salirhabdus sp. Marseille-P4669]|uniref:PspA/IM30 family protein n=1 Tax=Salirhabdus sp. Marseille-P4669 TaxID=2042310 RepID=UPI000C7D1C4C|nr:PspA/IM30 family protein [Salirhabdus sp. Marseille-P4669]
MANVFKRIKDTVSQDIHELLDEKEQKNPMAKLNHYIRESEKETEKVRKLIERQYRLKEEFTREHYLANEMAEKRKRQAEIAKKANEESMWEFANTEFEEYQARAERMKGMRLEAVRQLDLLEQKYEEMKHRLKDMKLKRMEVMGRENVVRAQAKINQVMSESIDKPYSRFNEMDEYIQSLEYKVNSAYYRNTFDSKIDALERKMQEQQEV